MNKILNKLNLNQMRHVASVMIQWRKNKTLHFANMDAAGTYTQNAWKDGLDIKFKAIRPYHAHFAELLGEKTCLKSSDW